MSKKILIPVNFEPETVKFLGQLSESMITNKSAIIRTIVNTSLEYPTGNLPEVLKNQIEKISKEFQVSKNG